MLVLSRRQGETIVVGNSVTVTVLEVRGNRVRLGFNAPMEVPIHREEVHLSIGEAAPALGLAQCH
jgi:carbon storage regulator